MKRLKSHTLCRTSGLKLCIIISWLLRHGASKDLYYIYLVQNSPKLPATSKGHIYRCTLVPGIVPKRPVRSLISGIQYITPAYVLEQLCSIMVWLLYVCLPRPHTLVKHAHSTYSLRHWRMNKTLLPSCMYDILLPTGVF